jgi:hypothetical protein
MTGLVMTLFALAALPRISKLSTETRSGFA